MLYHVIHGTVVYSGTVYFADGKFCCTQKYASPFWSLEVDKGTQRQNTDNVVKFQIHPA